MIVTSLTLYISLKLGMGIDAEVKMNSAVEPCVAYLLDIRPSR